MLVRQARRYEVFLMRRHKAMEFVGGVVGPPAAAWTTRTAPTRLARSAGVWAQQFGIPGWHWPWCAAARETFESQVSRRPAMTPTWSTTPACIGTACRTGQQLAVVR
jgi:hypothetical protein